MKKLKSKSLYIAVAVIIILIAIAIVYIAGSINKEGYITLKEDVNNSCSENGLSTAVSQQFVYIQVTSDKIEEYLSKAAQEHRCVYRDEDNGK